MDQPTKLERRPQPVNKKEKKPHSRISIFKILRAIAIGVGVYWLLTLTPALLLKFHGINLNPQQAVVEEDEPTYHDTNGKRINKPDFDLLTGYQSAKNNGIARHADCKTSFPSIQQGLMRMGCQRFVTEQKNIPKQIQQGNWGGGKTTAECQDEVNAHWGAVTKDMREKGDDHAANSWTNRNWMPDLKECQNYDNIRIATVVYEPTYRLDAILARMEKGSTATQEDRETVRHDIQQVSSFPSDEHTRSYFSKSDHFMKLADGLVKPYVEPPLNLSCAEFQSGMDALHSAEKNDIDTMAALKQGDRITDGARWSALNKSRIDRLWGLKRHMEGARVAGCTILVKPQ